MIKFIACLKIASHSSHYFIGPVEKYVDIEFGLTLLTLLLP